MKEPFETGASSSSSSSEWFLTGNLFLNTHFFKRGIVLVSPDEEHQSHVSDERKSFMINDREFMFHTLSKSKKSLYQPETRGIKKAQSLMHMLTDFASDRIDIRSPDLRVLFNRRRREEVFLPLLFNSKGNETGLYLYPWITKSSLPTSFAGFNRFVTAGCMFGATIKGITQDGESVELINHRLHLKPGQRIESVASGTETDNPYEDVLFSEFEKNCLLMSSFAHSDQSTSLLYHLPAIDYILFGLKLFIHQQMSYAALDQFVCAILIQKELHQKRLGKLCQLQNIEVTFDSPFFNLLPYIDTDNPTQFIFNQLGIDILIDAHRDCPNEAEFQFTASCISRLCASEHNMIHKQIWQDFINTEPQKPKTIEELFKTGNAIMIATASNGQDDYKVCSILPLSEKQIQLKYEQCRTNYNALVPAGHRPYPAIMNLTTFEPVITYSPTTNGLLFYFACYLDSLSSLITEKKIVHYASRNLGLFAEKSKKSESDAGSSSSSTLEPIDLQEIFRVQLIK